LLYINLQRVEEKPDSRTPGAEIDGAQRSSTSTVHLLSFSRQIARPFGSTSAAFEASPQATSLVQHHCRIAQAPACLLLRILFLDRSVLETGSSDQ
jgi:hypothetical protein